MIYLFEIAKTIFVRIYLEYTTRFHSPLGKHRLGCELV